MKKDNGDNYTGNLIYDTIQLLSSQLSLLKQK